MKQRSQSANNFVLETELHKEAKANRVHTIALALWNNTTSEQRKAIVKEIEVIKQSQKQLILFEV